MRYTINDAARQRTRDGTMAFFINQLDNLDRRFYDPLFNVTWGRDIQLREGITLANETTSFMRSSYAGDGTMKQGGMPWINPQSTTLKGVSVDGQMVTTPLRLLGREVAYSSVELEKSQLYGRPIDEQKMTALNNLYQMSTDKMVYVGDEEVGAEGLLNSSQVTLTTVATGSGGYTTWATKTPDEILADVNKLLNDTWAASAYAVCPDKLLLPPAQYSYLVSQKVSSAGNISIMQFLMDNSIALSINGKALDIKPVRWLNGLGTDGANRMLVYTNSADRVRFPMVPIRRETPYYQSISFIAPYIWAYGEVEFVYPETLRYADGI